ncbi:hypothetical protein QBC47DRAFT_394290 [Echria macrotheca]|uniref:Uncharacterized protein n=1 Tax=Echria macrotheca TaxID=438768 RepID=A0AAJ0B4X4_9PEZI|nr:hypothetical protein QBC47DRAFT_394290 [Echria macrotheca]
MLLTSSQVSVAVSSSIVVFFTAALFLSGYAIQQRTLRDLRAAIKPKPSPKIIVQEQFRKTQTVLGGGTAAKHDGTSEIVVEIRPTLPKKAGSDGKRQQKLDGMEDERRVEAEDDGQLAETQGQQGAPDGDAEPEKPQQPISRAERRRRIKEEIMKLAEGQQRGYYQRRLW